MGRWLFVRHGESVANAEGWLAGHRDAPLTERGRAQARAVASLVGGADRAFSSDLVRAHETARLALLPHPLEPLVTERIRERHLGAWEGLSRESLRATGHFDQLLGWETGPPGGESQRDTAARMLTWLAEVEDAGTTVVFSHGTAIRSVVYLLDAVPSAQIGRLSVGNAELIERIVPPRTWKRLLDAL